MPNNTILLKPIEDIARKYEEGRVHTGKTILPGMLIETTSTGTLQPHSTDGGEAECLVAIEDPLQGKTIDDSYAADDLCRYLNLLPGAEFQAILTTGQSVSPDEWWTSDGDGKIRVAVPGTDTLMGKFLETLVSAADDFVKVRYNPSSQS